MKLALVRGQYMKIGQINEVNRALVALSRLVEHGTHHGTIGSISSTHVFVSLISHGGMTGISSTSVIFFGL